MKRLSRWLCLLLLGICSILFLAPLLFVFTGSLMGSNEFIHSYGTNALRFPSVIPRLATFSQYATLLFNAPGYLYAYWNSLFIAAAICGFQLLFALPCAYGFAKLSFRGNRFLFFTYIVMMMMPFQVTMLPMFQLVKWFDLLDSQWSLILPEIFAPFIVFFLTQFIHQIPNEMIEAVRLESSNPFVLYRYLIIPLSKPGLIATTILSFVETWNMVEKPLLYLSDVKKYPMSMLLYEAGNQVSATTMAGCILYLLPVVLLWGSFKDDICSGISQLQIK